MNIVKKYPVAIKKIINIVMQCIIGNSYGCSRATQDSLHSILKLFDIDCWKSYFDNKGYIDANLLWSLSNDKLLKRWNSELDEIFDAFPELSSKYDRSNNEDSFKHMYRALISINSMN